MSDEAKNLLTATTMARMLRVSRKWLIVEADAGRVPCLRAGGAILFDRDAVVCALIERASKPHPREAVPA